jgi:hypothetical protein
VIAAVPGAGRIRAHTDFRNCTCVGFSSNCATHAVSILILCTAVRVHPAMHNRNFLHHRHGMNRNHRYAYAHTRHPLCTADVQFHASMLGFRSISLAPCHDDLFYGSCPISLKISEDLLAGEEHY